MERVLLVGLGGFIGSIVRYLLSGVSHSLFPRSAFPIGTVIVNLSGCFIIGLLSQLAESRNVFTDLTMALVFVGILGGFTTFSAFGNATINLFRSGEYLLASTYVLVQIMGGLLFVWMGRSVGQIIWP
jgi:CrcB protein